MSYATVQDLKNRLGDRYNGIYGDEVQLAQMDIESAEAEIDATIGVRYVTPIVAENSLRLVRSWTLTICEEYAFMRTSGASKNEKLDARVAQVRKLLRDASEGKIKLGDQISQAKPMNEAVFVEMNTPEFTRTKMSGY